MKNSFYIGLITLSVLSFCSLYPKDGGSQGLINGSGKKIKEVLFYGAGRKNFTREMHRETDIPPSGNGHIRTFPTTEPILKIKVTFEDGSQWITMPDDRTQACTHSSWWGRYCFWRGNNNFLVQPNGGVAFNGNNAEPYPGNLVDQPVYK